MNSSRRNRGLAITSSVGIAMRIAQVLSAFIVLPVLTRSLGIEQFGVWGVATSLAWAASILDLGAGNALITLIPRSLAGHTESEPSDIVGGALLFTVALSLIGAVGGAAVLCIRPGLLDLPFVVAGAALAINIPLGLSGRLWLALQKGYVGNAWEFAQTCVTTLLLVTGASTGWSVWQLVACVYGVTVAANCASFIHILTHHPELRPKRPPPRHAWRELIPQGGAMLGEAVASTAGWAFDNILTLLLLGPVAAAWMTVAMRLCTTALGFLGVISTSFWPAFAEAAYSDPKWIRRSLLRLGTLLTGIAFAGSLTLATLGGPFLRWWLGHDVGVNATMLWTVGFWVTAIAALQAPLVFLLAVARQRAPVIAFASAAIGGFALKILLAPHFGPAGILAVSPALNLLVVLPVCLWAAAARLNASEVKEAVLVPTQ